MDCHSYTLGNPPILGSISLKLSIFLWYINISNYQNFGIVYNFYCISSSEVMFVISNLILWIAESLGNTHYHVTENKETVSNHWSQRKCQHLRSQTSQSWYRRPSNIVWRRSQTDLVPPTEFKLSSIYKQKRRIRRRENDRELISWLIF